MKTEERMEYSQAEFVERGIRLHENLSLVDTLSRLYKEYAAQERNKAIDECIWVYNKTCLALYANGLKPTSDEITNALLKLKV